MTTSTFFNKKKLELTVFPGGRIIVNLQIDNLQIDNLQIDNRQIDNQNLQIDNLQITFIS